MAGSNQEHEAESWPPAIYHQMPAILEYLEDHRVVVVSAAPGSGKSSVLPRCLAESGYGPVLCAQPRHLAAFVAMAKVGEEWDSDIEFTTTRQLLDRFSFPAAVLAGYGAVVIDEAHDRTLGTDVLLGIVKAALATGTTMGGRCKVVPPGDVLAFLPENADIIGVHARLLGLPVPGLAVRYVHDNLPAELIDIMLINSPVPDGRRRVVLATDVAETAVLVHGITYVVDTGLVSEQPPVRISKEAAAARAAIAGFSGPGRCHRLYQPEEYDDLDEHTIPHIRQDGAAVRFALMVKRHAADGIPGFEIFDPALEPAVLKNVFGPVLDMAAAVADEVAAIHASQPPGDVLAFLPENADIIGVHARLLGLPVPGLAVRYVHDNLPAELIDIMLINSPVPDGRRRVVLATDVAETAVLVHGITYVVDTGLVSEQPPVRISKEAAAARAAIAGFSGPGRCHRLYQPEEYDDLDEHTIPHIRQDGAAVRFALMVKRHAADGIPGFEIFDPALEPAVLKNVFGQLVNGGYLDKLGNLSDKGEREAYDED
ncbi:hypothetical protein OsJ_10383 [Oryza sativa Japonica Group]|uniref:Helicase C-terminal domain-containing protein n=1 Tax=Oryza sativa subsp. japonica TaxID=39947 RepID=B9F7D8_ORYSJ|nr:hypothetical protein OsJ_10383 [Oryza sativa Japonica Group]